MSTKGKRICIWTSAVAMILLFLVLLTTTIFASEPDDIFSVQAVEDSLYDGYIFKLKDDVKDVPDKPDTGIELLQADEGLYTAESLEEIGENFSAREIEYIEPDYILTAADAVVNDPLYGSQWGLSNTNAEAVLKVLQDGDITLNATVGVIDSGLRMDHEDFVYTNIEGKNYNDDSSDLSDVDGHGTMVTSVIAATTNNGLGNASLGYGANVVVLKGAIHYTDEYGTQKVGMLTSTMVDMIYSGVNDYGCDVINISYGGSDWNQSMATACLYAYSKGVIICAAVGNDSNDTLNYPAALDSVIGVGATNDSNNRASYSNYNESVFVVAPGSSVSVASVATDYYNYTTASGTSFAAPFVSALAVLAKSYDPDMSVEDFKSLLKNTATDKGTSGYDTEYGYGLVNCEAFIILLRTEYTVTLTGAGGGTITGPATARPGNTVTLTSTPDTGKRFDHWDVLEGDVTMAGNQFIMPEHDVQIEGIFVSEYTLRYEPSGGSGTAPSQTYIAGEMVTVAASTFTPPTGKSFAGWNTAADGNGETLQPGAALTMPGSDLVLYAVWRDAHIAYVAGFGDGTFRPDAAMSRAEAVQMLYNMSKILGDVPEVTSTCIFSDVPSGEWYYTAVVAMTDRNVISGYGDGTFRPGNTITRAEFTAMVVKYAGLTVDERGGFPDVSSTYWAAGFIRAASEAGYVSGYTDGNFGPEDNINRASTVALLNNMQGRYPDVDILETLVMPFPDVLRSHWAWTHIMDAAVGY